MNACAYIFTAACLQCHYGTSSVAVRNVFICVWVTALSTESLLSLKCIRLLTAGAYLARNTAIALMLKTKKLWQHFKNQKACYRSDNVTNAPAVLLCYLNFFLLIHPEAAKPFAEDSCPISHLFALCHALTTEALASRRKF